MVKKRKKLQKKIPQKLASPPREEITSSPPFNPNATLTPDAIFQSPTNSHWLSRDSTTAPTIGEQSDDETPYAESHAALIDKYVLSRHSIPFVLALCVIGYIFIQDNGAEKLTNWEELWWTIQKSAILLFLFHLILLVQFFYKKIF